MTSRFAARRPGSPALAALILALALALPLPAAAQPARGQPDPVVSWGLSGLSDWGTNAPFLDIARLMRPFFGYAGSEWKSLENEDLARGGHLDEHGYPLRIPPGMTGIRTIWDWGSEGPASAGRAGIYILSHEGSGTIELGGGAKVTARAPGRIVFENARGTTFRLDITATDPGGRGDHIRAISILRADRAALAAAGAVFDPDWLAQVRDAREVRFMDWTRTNSSTVTGWAGRALAGDASWVPQGPPVEIMVRLANEAGVDPWFTMPHMADDDYMRQFATVVRDRLDPRLKAHVEYSNETWNGAFPQFGWLRDAAIAEWGGGIAEDWGAIHDYHAKRATEVALIWREVFGDEAPARLVTVLGTQAVNTWLSGRLLTAETWAARDPAGYVAPASVFDELAATTYFGSRLVGDAALRSEILARAGGPQGRLYAWMFERLAFGGDKSGAIPDTLARLAEQRAIADRHGVRLVAYEGGQHVHHSFAVGDLSDDEARALQDVLAGFVRSPEMGALYAQLWDGWAEVGQGPFMQFTEMGTPSRWGSWGLLSHKGDRTPRADLVLTRQARGGSWWGEGGGPQYLYGVSVSGTEGPDRLTGTDEEDYLLGHGGDDVFVASPGDDGINGGAGTDTYVLPGPRSDHRIEREGAGWRVTGPMGSDYLFDVEIVEFGDGTRIELD
jgi:hypothetical protein